MITFYKLNGAGNDFVVFDNRKGDLRLDTDKIAYICDRRFGVGADGLITLDNGDRSADFVMHYYNADGHEADMCGNGGRCITLFAFLMGVETSVAQESGTTYVFKANDGMHKATLLDWDESEGSGTVDLLMRPVAAGGVRPCLDGWLINTGVPHYVQTVEDLEHYDVVGEGRRLRHHQVFGSEGANVDFVERLSENEIAIRTYERGVEDETLACGTGVTASAIVTGSKRVKARGGDFSVDYTKTAEGYDGVHLTGPVALNFIGEIGL